MEIGIGQYSIPIILSVILGVIYKSFPEVPDRWKPLITIAVGLVLGMGAMFYTEQPVTLKLIMDFLLLGLMGGAAAIGLYEAKRAVGKNPRK